MGILKEILSGWTNLIFGREVVIGKIRMDVCNRCEHHSKHHVTPERPDAHCTICKCTLAAKTRSLESDCPIGRWPPAVKNKNNGKEKIHIEKSSSGKIDSDVE